MEDKINLKQLEKSSAAAIFQTGIVEIGIGLVWIVSSLAMIYDDISYYIDILFIIPVIFMILGIKYIVNPRMGIVKYARKRVKRTKIMGITITSLLIIMVALTAFGKINLISEYVNARWVITGIIFFICVAVAYFLSFQRMYLYAFLLAGAFNLSEEVRENPGILPDSGYAYLIASGVLFIIGTYFLIKFLKKYRLQEKGE